MSSKLLVATGNQGKIKEISALLASAGIEVLSIKELSLGLDVVEDRDSFQGNAIKKASEWAEASGILTLADDSGLEVDALGGAPGVYSARFGGDGLDDTGRNRHLLHKLAGVSDEQRTARFRCVLALCDPQAPDPVTFDGALEGRIAHAISGEHGFGYDPLFIPEGHSETLAVLGAEVKNRISHRALALAQFARWFKQTPYWPGAR